MPAAVEAGDRLGRLRLDRVVDDDQPGDGSIDHDIGDRATAPRRLRWLRPRGGARSDAVLANQARAPDQHGSRAGGDWTSPIDAAARDRLEAVDAAEPELIAQGPRPDRLARAGARCPSRAAPARSSTSAVVKSGRRRDRRDRRAARAVSVPVLSRMTAVIVVGHLEGLAAADQDAGLGAATGPDHDRRRRGQAHRARARDDDDRDERDERVGELRLGSRARTSRRTRSRRGRARAGRSAR